MPDAASALDVRSVGERIERLLDASAASGPLVRERAEELLRLVADLYGAGLERVLELAYDAGALSDDLLDALADDELVSGLLLVHGLHPYPVEDAVTLDLAVKDAVEAAAPEIVRIEVVEEAAKPSAGLITVDSLTARLRAAETGPPVAGQPSWESIGPLADLPPTPLWSLTVGGLDVVICRIGASLYAYRGSCAACRGSLATAAVEKRLGQPGSAVLTCPSCRAHFDVRRAGVGIDDESLHLEPLPLLERDGVIEIAVPSGVAA
jgi:nitrite reductase/ring-hydroxylating ferredoxin subunit